jgi:carbonic anhydrase
LCRAIYELHYKELDLLPYDQKERRLAELNIEQQIKNLGKLELIQKAWKQGAYPKLYGWYFNLNTGLFTEISKIDPAESTS